MLTCSDNSVLSNHSEGRSVSSQLHSRTVLNTEQRKTGNQSYDDNYFIIHSGIIQERQMPKSPMSSRKHFTDRKVTEFSELFLSIASLLSIFKRTLPGCNTRVTLCLPSKYCTKIQTVKLVRHWNRLHREALDASSLKVFKTSLDGALSYLV